MIVLSGNPSSFADRATPYYLYDAQLRIEQQLEMGVHNDNIAI